MLALIPARGGSKGVPGKNIRALGGRPLIHWTIEAAMRADHIDQVVLSTDDEGIAALCRPMGVEIPFMRPAELAQDNSLAIDTYVYTMNRLFQEGRYDQDEFVVLLPTVPFRNAADIDGGIELFRDKQADSVISCTQLSHPVDWVFSLDAEARIRRDEGKEGKRLINRQDVTCSYIPNGGVYVFRHSLLESKRSYYFDRTFAYVMPQERSLDIDTEQDFMFASFLCESGRISDSDIFNFQ